MWENEHINLCIVSPSTTSSFPPPSPPPLQGPQCTVSILATPLHHRHQPVVPLVSQRQDCPCPSSGLCPPPQPSSAIPQWTLLFSSVSRGRSTSIQVSQDLELRHPSRKPLLHSISSLYHFPPLLLSAKSGPEASLFGCTHWAHRGDPPQPADANCSIVGVCTEGSVNGGGEREECWIEEEVLGRGEGEELCYHDQ